MPGIRSVLDPGRQLGLHAQLGRDASLADAPIEFLVPVIDPTFLVVERDALESPGLDGFLDLLGELGVLFEDALEVREPLLPEWIDLAATPVRGEPGDLDLHGARTGGPEQDERVAGGVDRRDQVRVEEEQGLLERVISVAVSMRRMPRVPGSCQSGRRFGVTIKE